jgi:cytochrome c-type biogenesis protein CcmF
VRWPTVLGFAAAYWVVAGVVLEAWPTSGSFTARWQRLALRSPAQWGMSLAHLGIAVFIVGVVSVKGYEQERDVRVKPGDSLSLAGHEFLFRGVREVPGPNYRALVGDVDVLRDGRLLRTLQPEKRVYRVQQNPMTEAAIATGLTGDQYVALGEELDDGSWTLRVYIKPFVDWIWGGCLLMAFGGLLAVADRRYRQAARAPQANPEPHPGAAMQEQGA